MGIAIRLSGNFYLSISHLLVCCVCMQLLHYCTDSDGISLSNGLRMLVKLTMVSSYCSIVLNGNVDVMILLYSVVSP